MAELFNAVAQAIREDELCAVVTVLSGDEIGRKLLVRRARKPDGRGSTLATKGSLGDTALEQTAIARAAEAMEARGTTRISLSIDEREWDLLIDVHVPQEVLVIVGAVHIAIPLVSFARELGLYTVVVDARPIFATQDRFDHADELIRSWPEDALQKMKLNESTYVVTLTHDEKLDTPALICALDHPVGYIGALGSKRTSWQTGGGPCARPVSATNILSAFTRRSVSTWEGAVLKRSRWRSSRRLYRCEITVRRRANECSPIDPGTLALV